MTSAKFIEKLDLVLDPRKTSLSSPWTRLQAVIGAPLPDIHRFFRNMNPANVATRLKRFLHRLKECSEFQAYSGSFTAGFRRRFNEHAADHGELNGRVISKCSSLQEALLCEIVVIQLLRDIVKGKEPNLKLRGCWNDLDGWDSGSLVSSTNKGADDFGVYLLWSKTPHKKPDKTVGLVRSSAVSSEREFGPVVWDLNSSQNVSKDSTNMKTHFSVYSHINLKCHHCNLMFTKETARILHELVAHKEDDDANLVGCELCSENGNLAYIRKHLEEVHKAFP